MNDKTIDKRNPATWERFGKTTSDGQPVLINPATGGQCVMPPAHWRLPQIPRSPEVYESERLELIRSKASQMLAVLHKVAGVMHMSDPESATFADSAADTVDALLNDCGDVLRIIMAIDGPEAIEPPREDEDEDEGV
jgi:hypothetical protein